MTGDTPGRTPFNSQVKLGSGPGLFLYDTSALPGRRLVAMTRETANEKSVSLQLDLVQGYGDDSEEIQKSSGGVPTVNLVVPVRYRERLSSPLPILVSEIETSYQAFKREPRVPLST